MTPQRRPSMSKLKLMALDYVDELEEADRRKRNITPLFYDALPKMLAADELINAQINGEPGSGKSTVCAALLFHVNTLLDVATIIDHFLPNQIVYTHIMRSLPKDRLDICIGVDEYEDLGDTGYNATTDNAMLNHFSNLHRANYIHKFACAPKDTIDKNANIILEVVAPDKKHKYTRCFLYYRMFLNGVDRQTLLGYVDIDVSAVIDSAFYKEYYDRKMERLALFSTYGIAHEKHIFIAELILHAYEQLKELAIHTKIDHTMADLQIDISARHCRLHNSIIAGAKFSRDLLALLNYLTYQHKEVKRMQKARAADDLGLVAVLQRTVEQLGNQLEDALTYWRNAQSLKALYISKLPEKWGDTGAVDSHRH